MAHREPRRIELDQRCTGPPSSPIKGFRVPELPQSYFLAYGVGDGLAVLQQIQAGPGGAIVSGAPMVLELKVGGEDSRIRVDEGGGGSMGVQVGSKPARLGKVTLVEWFAVEETRLLAAASGADVCVFSLGEYFNRLGRGGDPLGESPPSFPVTCMLSHTSELVAMSWTQAGDGLLVSGTGGEISMYQIPEASGSSSIGPPPHRLTQIWSGSLSTVTHPQTLLSAGAHSWAPAATGQPGSRHVTVWWPPIHQEARHQRGSPKSAAERGASNEAPKSAAEAEFSSETLKILNRVAPQPGAQSSQEGDAGKDENLELLRDWTVAEQLRHPTGVVSIQWSPGSLQKGQHHYGPDDEDLSEFAPSSQPALLTVTQDGVLRIWVEVTLTASSGTNPLAAAAVTAAPGVPEGAHFCVTLVVQPPHGTWVGDAPRGLRVAWGVPEGGVLVVTGPQIRAAKVMWITAVAEAEGANGEKCDKLLMWAVDGLAGVVLGNLQGAVGSGRPCKTPRAVFWGQHTGQLSWTGLPRGEVQHSVTVSIEADAPTLHVFESHQNSNVGEYRLFRIDTVEEEPFTPSGPPTPVVRTAVRQLTAQSFASGVLVGHGDRITSLATHPRQPYALTLDASGGALLWDTATLAAKHPVTWKGQVTAITFLQQPEDSRVLAAAADAEALHILSFSPAAEDFQQLLASVALPSGAGSVKSLAVFQEGDEMRLLGWLSNPTEGLRAPEPGEDESGFDWIALWRLTSLHNVELLFRERSTFEKIECWALPPFRGLLAAAGSGQGVKLLTLAEEANSLSIQNLGTRDIEGVCSALSFSAAGKLAAAFRQAASGRLLFWNLLLAEPTALVSEHGLDNQPVSIQWLDAAFAAEALAVSFEHRDLAIIVQTREGGWQQIVKLEAAQFAAPLLSLTASQQLLAASGSQVALVSERVSGSREAPLKIEGCSALEAPGLGAVIQAVGGPLPEWHPEILKLLVARGRFQAAAKAVRQLLKLLKQEPNEFWGQGSVLEGGKLLDESLVKWSASLPAELFSGGDVRDVAAKLPAGGQPGGTSTAPKPAQPAPDHGKQAPDPFAFDMSAFGDPAAGMSHAAEQAPSKPSNADPFAFDIGAFGGPPPEQLPENAAAADPFAFDANAFGIAPVDGSRSSAEQPAADPFAFDMSAFGGDPPVAEAEEAPSALSQQDPFAFDMSAFGGAQTLGGLPQQPPPSPGPPPVSATRSTSQTAASSRPQQSGKAQLRPSSRKPDRVQMEPLTVSELSELRDWVDDRGKDSNDDSADHDESAAEGEPDFGPFGRGQAARNAAETVCKIAEVLTSGQPNSLAEAQNLDAAAQMSAAAIQLASLERGEPVGEPPSTSGRPFEPPSRHSEHPTGSWTERKLGLLAGFGADAVLWALMSESQEALLAVAAATVFDEGGKDTTTQPKYDYTSKGHKTLDLGFGAKRTPSSTGLTWQQLRKVGGGFWLRDPAAVKQHAETLAKTRFAETRDPSSCALFYAALGKKNLLQGLFRSAQQHKQADFLSRDFEQQKHREAACKNAFVLLGQHRFELAAAFFVLGGAFKDAVGVCSEEMEDPQLALFLCRVLEGSDSALERHVLETLITEAENEGESEASALFRWLRGDHREAVADLLRLSDGRLPPRTLAGKAAKLELLRHALGALPPSAAAQPATGQRLLQQSCVLWSLALSEIGAAGLALEAACIGETLAEDGGPLSQQLGSRWSRRSLACTLLRPPQQSAPSAAAEKLLGSELAAASAKTSDCRQAVSAATENLKRLDLEIDAEAVLEQLQQMHAKIWSPKLEPPSMSEGLAETSSLLDQSSHRRSFQGPKQHIADSGKLFTEGYELMRTDDKLHAVCACNSDAGDWGNPSAEWRPLVAASARRGLIEGELTPPKGQTAEDVLSSATSESSHKGSTFSALLSEMLDAMRWPPDPWTMVAPLPGATVGATGSTEAVLLSNSPSHRGDHVATATLAAHPYRPIFLSGSATGEIYLWQFGRKGAVAGYTPLPATSKAPPVTSLFSSSARSWNSTPGVSISQWGQPQSVRFSECGERFAAIGEGGVVAAWRVDAPRLAASDTGALGRADWCHQGLTKRGVDVTYVGGSTSVLAAGGFCQQAGNVVIWDTLAPAAAAPIARLFHHPNMVTSLQALPGGRVLATADETGLIAAVDLRMVGGNGGGKALLWQSRNPSGGVTCMSSTARPSDGFPLLVSGSRTGALCIWTANHGQLLQSLPADAPQSGRPKGRSLFQDALRGKQNGSSPVTEVVVCAEGLVSCTLHGRVNIHPFAPT